MTFLNVTQTHQNTIFSAIHNGKKPGEVKEFSNLTASVR